MSTFEVSYVLLWFVVAVLLLGVAGLYSAFGVIYAPNSPRAQRRSGASPTLGPELGDRISVPDRLFDVTGDQVDPAAPRWIFVSTTCEPCLQLREALRDLGSADLHGATVVVCSGAEEAVSEWGSDLPGWIQLVSDEDGEIFDRFNVTATPLYVGLVDGRCVVAGPASNRRGLDRKEERLADHLPSAGAQVATY